jgi:vacuolar-type H+-ATPase subunit E/Vma4
MAIEDILRALDEQADSDCRTLVEHAKQQAKSILADAKAEADRVQAAKVGSTETQVRSRAVQIVNAAKIERRRRVSAAQDAGVDKVYSDAGAVLAGSRGTKEYETIGDVSIQVAPDDVALAKTVMADLGLKGEVDSSAKILGGLTVISSAGRVYRRNTFDDRLAKVRKHVQSEVAEILFA